MNSKLVFYSTFLSVTFQLVEVIQQLGKNLCVYKTIFKLEVCDYYTYTNKQLYNPGKVSPKVLT